MGQKKSRHIHQRLTEHEESQMEEKSEEGTLTSDFSITDASSMTVCSANTSFGLISLPAEQEVEDWPMYPIEHKYLDGVRRYMAREPVCRRRVKRVKVIRRLQSIRRSRVGYTQLFREVRRRRRVQETLELPPLTKLFEQLSFRPERTFQR